MTFFPADEFLLNVFQEANQNISPNFDLYVVFYVLLYGAICRISTLEGTFTIIFL